METKIYFKQYENENSYLLWYFDYGYIKFHKHNY